MSCKSKILKFENFAVFPKPSPAFKDEGERCFFTGRKKAVANGRLNLVDRQEARDVWSRMGRTSGGHGSPRAGEDILKTGMTCRRSGTTPVPAHFWFFLCAQKELAAETVDPQKSEV